MLDRADLLDAFHGLGGMSVRDSDWQAKGRPYWKGVPRDEWAVHNKRAGLGQRLWD